MSSIRQSSIQTLNLPNLPRFHRQFIGIGHQLEQKKKQRKRIEQQQRALANRVLLLQKQQIKAQKKFKKKNNQFNKLIQTLDRNYQHKEEKQKLRQLRQMQLQILREQNKQRRLIHKQISQTSRSNLQMEKHNDYSRIKNFIKKKQGEKRIFLHEDYQNKRDQWLSLNISKQKGKHKIDNYYKKKNKQHTNHYLSLIEKEQKTKNMKQNTIKHLEYYQSALKKKLQQSTMKVSQIQGKIMQKSRTIQVPRVSESLHNNNGYINPLRKQSSSRITQIQSLLKQKNRKNSSREQSFLSQKPGYLSERDHSSQNNNQQQVQQKIANGVQEIQMNEFKLIRTTKKKKKSPSIRYKQYQFI